MLHKQLSWWSLGWIIQFSWSLRERCVCLLFCLCFSPLSSTPLSGLSRLRFPVVVTEVKWYQTRLNSELQVCGAFVFKHRRTEAQGEKETRATVTFCRCTSGAGFSYNSLSEVTSEWVGFSVWLELSALSVGLSNRTILDLLTVWPSANLETTLCCVAVYNRLLAGDISHPTFYSVICIINMTAWIQVKICE